MATLLKTPDGKIDEPKKDAKRKNEKANDFSAQLKALDLVKKAKYEAGKSRDQVLMKIVEVESEEFLWAELERQNVVIRQLLEQKEALMKEMNIKEALGQKEKQELEENLKCLKNQISDEAKSGREKNDERVNHLKEIRESHKVSKIRNEDDTLKRDREILTEKVQFCSDEIKKLKLDYKDSKQKVTLQMLQIASFKYQESLKNYKEEIISLRKRQADSHNACNFLQNRVKEIVDFFEEILDMDKNGIINLTHLTDEQKTSLRKSLSDSRSLSHSLSHSLMIGIDSVFNETVATQNDAEASSFCVPTDTIAEEFELSHHVDLTLPNNTLNYTELEPTKDFIYSFGAQIHSKIDEKNKELDALTSSLSELFTSLKNKEEIIDAKTLRVKELENQIAKLKDEVSFKNQLSLQSHTSGSSGTVVEQKYSPFEMKSNSSLHLSALDHSAASPEIESKIYQEIFIRPQRDSSCSDICPPDHNVAFCLERFPSVSDSQVKTRPTSQSDDAVLNSTDLMNLYFRKNDNENLMESQQKDEENSCVHTIPSLLEEIRSLRTKLEEATTENDLLRGQLEAPLSGYLSEETKTLTIRPVSLQEELKYYKKELINAYNTEQQLRLHVEQNESKMLELGKSLGEFITRNQKLEKEGISALSTQVGKASDPRKITDADSQQSSFNSLREKFVSLIKLHNNTLSEKSKMEIMVKEIENKEREFQATIKEREMRIEDILLQLDAERCLTKNLHIQIKRLRLHSSNLKGHNNFLTEIQELREQKRDLYSQLTSTKKHLENFKQNTESMECYMVKQLSKTYDILKKTKSNLSA